MENDNKLTQNGTSSWPLFLSGAAIGAALGVLLAPDSGRENRRKLAEWLKEKRENGGGKLLCKKEQVAAAIAAGKQAYKDNAKTMAGV